MSLNLGVMNAAVTLDDGDYRKKLAGLEGASSRTFQKIAQLAAGYLSLRALVGFGSDAIKTFSDLEEETNKFNVVFQGLGADTNRVLAEMRKNFGLSELSAKKMLAGTGDILTGFGFDRATALALSEGAAKLGADIASFSNYSGGAEGATNALTKAMLGETESAKMLGVVIRQDDENYKSLIKQAMTTGVTIDAIGKTFIVSSEQQAKAVAALAMAYQQSPNAIGDFVRSQDSIANQTRILQNNFEQLYSTVGGDLSESYQTALQSANALLKAYNDLSPAARALTHHAVILSGAFLLVSRTPLKQIMTFGAGVKTVGTSALFTSAGLKAAAASAKAFFASIGPVGWALIALTAAYEAASYMTNKYRAELDGAIDDSGKAVQAANELAEANRKARASDNGAMERLQTLSKYERLNNAEKSEAEKLIKQLTDRYGKLGIEIDSVTGKLIGTEAMKRMNEEQAKEYRKDLTREMNAAQRNIAAEQNGLSEELGSYIANLWGGAKLAAKYTNPFVYLADKSGLMNANGEDTNANQNALDDAMKLKTTEEQILALEKLRDKLANANEPKKKKRLDEYIKKLKDYQVLEKQLSEANQSRQAGDSPDGNTPTQRAVNEEQRKALASYQDSVWKIKYDDSDSAGKLAMLEEKLRTLNAEKENSIKRDTELKDLTKEQLELLEKIRDVEAKRDQLKKTSAKAFDSELESYKKYLKNREDLRKNKEVERELQKANKSGDRDGAGAIMQREYEKAREAAKSMQREYEQAVSDAKADGVLTEEEKKRVADLRDKMQSAMSDMEKWEDRIKQAQDMDRTTKRTVGGWSAMQMTAMLGAQSPQERTAKASERTAKNTDKMLTKQNRSEAASYGN